MNSAFFTDLGGVPLKGKASGGGGGQPTAEKRENATSVRSGFKGVHSHPGGRSDSAKEAFHWRHRIFPEERKKAAIVTDAEGRRF